MTRATIVLLALVATAAAAAQRPTFDAASVKVNTSPDPGIMTKPTPGREFYGNAPLRIVIERAYGIRPYQLLDMPEWTTREKFDISATYAAERRPQVPQMLQSLLEDRFRLRVRRETREMPIYELVKGRADGTLGPGLEPSTTDCAAPPGQRSPCSLRIQPGLIDATGMRWGFLPTNIGIRDRPVIDKTGLNGVFDVKLEWAPDPANPGDRVAIFTALQEQLGLKLEPTRGPVDVVVVESIERPTPD